MEVVRERVAERIIVAHNRRGRRVVIRRRRGGVGRAAARCCLRLLHAKRSLLLLSEEPRRMVVIFVFGSDHRKLRLFVRDIVALSAIVLPPAESPVSVPFDRILDHGAATVDQQSSRDDNRHGGIEPPDFLVMAEDGRSDKYASAKDNAGGTADGVLLESGRPQVLSEIELHVGKDAEDEERRHRQREEDVHALQLVGLDDVVDSHTKDNDSKNHHHDSDTN
mmetsp:Transcript_15701/g.59714  ORF Transcript_15701/g.59714 Transcript_15701/m.59714 type:complete len:222 (+) Transcript_15701:1701-2366(+)